MFIGTLENFKPSLTCGNLYSILEILEILDTIYSHETSFNNVCLNVLYSYHAICK